MSDSVKVYVFIARVTNAREQTAIATAFIPGTFPAIVPTAGGYMHHKGTVGVVPRNDGTFVYLFHGYWLLAVGF